MSWFSRKKPEPEETYQEKLERLIIELDDHLQVRPPIFRSIRPFWDTPSYQNDFKGRLMLGKWNSSNRGFDIVFDPQSR